MLSNSVFKHRESAKKLFYYIPTYPRLVVHRLKLIDIAENYGLVAATLYISFNLRGVSRQYRRICLEHIKLVINHYESIKMSINMADQQLNDGEYESYFEDETEMATFVITRKFEMEMSSEVFLSPFERIYLSLTLNVKSHHFVERSEKGEKIRNITFKFNILKHRDKEEFMISFFSREYIYGQYLLVKNKEYVEIDVGNYDTF